MKIRKGDTVKIISGNDKGKQGKVLSVSPKDGTIVIEGANMKKKHVRARQQGKKGEKVLVPAPVRTARVMLVCPKCGKPTRLGHQLLQGQKLRVCKRCGSEV